MNICKNIIRKFSVVPLSPETKKYPLCKDCKFFTSEFLISNILDLSFGKCKKFGSLHLTTGKVEYKYANTCRIDGYTSYTSRGHNIPECGTKGLLFEKKKVFFEKIN